MLKQSLALLKTVFQEWMNDKTPQLGAALAYYAVFSLVPVIIISMTIVGLVLGEKGTPEQVIGEISSIMGTSAGEAVGTIVKETKSMQSGWSSIVGVIVLLFGSIGFFGQLQEALNIIWGVQPDPNRGWSGFFRDRLMSFLAVLVMGILILASLLINITLTQLQKFAPAESIRGGVYAWQGINLAMTFLVLTTMFALIYRLLPDVRIAWRDVWIGAAGTAGLFIFGKYLIGLYLKYSQVSSAYGAVGSVVAILIWVFYSSQIFLLGAEFTQVYAHLHGSRQGKDPRLEVQAASNK